MTTPPIKISDEAIEAATRAIHGIDCPEPDGEACFETLTTTGRYGRYAEAALEAAAPLIAAQVLRDARWQIMRGVWSDTREESDDLEDSEIVGRALCDVWGHEPTQDHCGIAAHDYCGCCGERTPNQAERPAVSGGTQK